MRTLLSRFFSAILVKKKKFGLAKMSNVSLDYDPTRSATTKMIGTHSGKFHCDEVLACSLLRELTEFKNAEIVRSRDQNVLAKCDIVVDVGGVFNPSILRFDHHQRDFNHSMSSLVSGK